MLQLLCHKSRENLADHLDCELGSRVERTADGRRLVKITQRNRRSSSVERMATDCLMVGAPLVGKHIDTQLRIVRDCCVGDDGGTVAETGSERNGYGNV
ncbi:unnamed protein product [Strongylus vulgaris]|uniref:Uncharacterized protein n=1 Tax=Strongylus vulgaris TaxID=40348 RepID=A0A3P7JJY8_STRVU|nr:unnamed protein product [Strongylus vulgaris]